MIKEIYNSKKTDDLNAAASRVVKLYNIVLRYDKTNKKKFKLKKLNA